MSESEERSRVTNVLVKNLSESVTEEDLKRIFGEFGSITSTVVKRHDDGTSKCFGFVDFENPEDANRAVESLNGKEFDDKKWVVEGAQERSEIELQSKIQFDELALKDDAGEGSQNSKLYAVKNRDQRRGTGVFTPMARGHQGPCHGAGAFMPMIHPLNPPDNLACAQSSPAAKNLPLGYGFGQISREEVHGGRFVPSRVYVGNLSESVTEEDLKNIFGEFGSIASTVVKRNEDGTSRCYGVVTFGSHEDAAKAIESLNGKEFSDKKWLVERTQNKHEREIELTSKKLSLFVSGLDDSCDDQKLKELFAPYGLITSFVLLRDPDGKSKRAGFVAFSSPEEASKAISAMNGREIGSRYLHVEYARTRERLQIETVPAAAPATTSPAAVSPAAIAPVPPMQIYNIHDQPSAARARAIMSPQAQFRQMAPVPAMEIYNIHDQPSVAPAIMSPQFAQMAPVPAMEIYNIHDQPSLAPAIMPPQAQFGQMTPVPVMQIYNVHDQPSVRPATMSPQAQFRHMVPVPAMEIYNVHDQPSVARTPAIMPPQVQFGQMAPVPLPVMQIYNVHDQPSVARAPAIMPPQLQFGQVSPQMLHDVRQQISYGQQPPPAITSPQSMVWRPKAQQQQVWRPKAQQQGPPRPQGN